MNTSSTKSSPVMQAESPEYMDVDGFEGFFYETSERRIVEFEDFISNPEHTDSVDGELDCTADKSLESDEEDELLLLNEILNFKGEVGNIVNDFTNMAVQRTQCVRFSRRFFITRIFVLCMIS